MRLLKSHFLLRLLNSYLIDSPQPANISYLWNFGSLLGVCLIIQILTGVFLAMHYTPHVDFAFNSVEHIMRDVNAGYILRYTHANVASFFFIFVYAQCDFYIYLLNFQNICNLIPNLFYFKVILDYFLHVTKSKTINNLKTESNFNVEDDDFLQWFVGFSDAESNFKIDIISKNKTQDNSKSEDNFEVRLIFNIVQKQNDLLILIKQFLGGNIYYKNNLMKYLKYLLNITYLSPRRFELLQIPHQEIILPLNYRLMLNISGTVRFELTTFSKVLVFKTSAINQTRPNTLIFKFFFFFL